MKEGKVKRSGRRILKDWPFKRIHHFIWIFLSKPLDPHPVAANFLECEVINFLITLKVNNIIHPDEKKSENVIPCHHKTNT